MGFYYFVRLERGSQNSSPLQKSQEPLKTNSTCGRNFTGLFQIGHFIQLLHCNFIISSVCYHSCQKKACLSFHKRIYQMTLYRYNSATRKGSKKTFVIFRSRASKKSTARQDERPFRRWTKSVRPGRLLCLLCLRQTRASDSNTC